MASFKHLDGCPENVTVVASDSPEGVDLDLLWPEQPFGGLAEIPCPCEGVSLPATATRRCAGNFGSGVEWMEPDDSECAFSDVARQLCALPDVRDIYILTVVGNNSGFTS